MRRTRYVAVVAQSPAVRSSWQARLEELVRSAPDVRWVLNAGRLLVVASGELARPLGEHGILIGSIFRRASAESACSGRGRQQLGPKDLAHHLAEHCWGGFIVIQEDHDGQSVSIFRAPLGDLPCFWSMHDDAVVLGSDLSMMGAAGLPQLRIDGNGLARYLAREDIRTGETCLNGLTEISGGEMLTFIDGEPRSEALWSPWTFASSDCAIDETREAERRVRDAALLSTRTLAQDQNGIVLKLSGGLDSSIVAACLKESRRAFTAVNLVTGDASGDEREHARLVAQSLGVPLVEAFRDVQRVSLERSAAARLPRPAARTFTQETARICTEVAAETGSSAIFDGGGGDNVFCSVQSARPAADRLLTQGPGPLFWRTAADIARLAQVSLWQVAKRACSIALRRSPAYRWDVDLRFLSDEASAHVTSVADHPWLASPSGMLPGKIAHVALLAAAQSVIEGYDPQEELPTFSPLIVQPVAEACLTVPSWQWFEAGRNRAAARRAFAGHLPSATLERRSKGAPDSFVAEIYEANRPTIRAMLMDGVLMSLNLLDRARLSEALDDEAPVRGHDFLRVMRLADAEVWARCWS